MERLIFTNGIGESIVIPQSFPIFLKSFKGVGDLAYEVQQEKAPYQDGTSYLGSVADSRDMALQLVIVANTAQELYEHRRMLSRIFNPRLGNGVLRYENDYLEKDIEVSLESAPKFPTGKEARGSTFQIANIEMVAVEPYWEDTFRSSELLAAVIPLFHFELDLVPGGIEFGSYSDGVIEVENVGDVDTPLQIEFYGPVVDPRITNETTGEFIELIIPLLEGEKMTITTAFGNKRAEITKVGGSVENAFQYINLESDFFQLVRGRNKINFTASAGSEDAELTIVYRNRYVGI